MTTSDLTGTVVSLHAAGIIQTDFTPTEMLINIGVIRRALTQVGAKSLRIVESERRFDFEIDVPAASIGEAKPIVNDRVWEAADFANFGGHGRAHESHHWALEITTLEPVQAGAA
jgi:hypothetical protein